MPAPLAYFISWTTKGTWLAGDPRGFVLDDVEGVQEPDPALHDVMRSRLNGSPVVLSASQRRTIHETVAEHCRVRGWNLLAINARTNHVHVIVDAPSISPETVMEQFKAWCSRRLNEHGPIKRKWWTEHGSTEWINEEAYLARAIEYVLHKQ